ncbi:MAG: cation:proton antiporter [Eggerthellaceae bacterium]
MATFELILLLLCAVIVSSVLERMIPKVSIPLVQIGLGAIIGTAVTSTLDVMLNPNLFLLLFVAPLLFYEAKTSDKFGLWKNRKIILSLAIGLVVAISVAVGFGVHALLPTIPLAAAFALGFALGPTDAVAVSSLSETADLDRNVSARLYGEALLNDASGVVGFQFAAAAAVTGGTFSLLHGTLDFSIDFFGGILLGVALGFLTILLFRIIDQAELGSNVFYVLFDVTLPFVIFLLAEVASVSGILAVVSAGIVIGIKETHQIGPSRSSLNIVTENVWKVMTFTLNGIVFVLLGMQLPRAMFTTWNDTSISNVTLIACIFAITAILVVVRFVWLCVMDSLEKNPETGARNGFTKHVAKSALLATIGGPKGAVTLSVILSLPFMLDDGSLFPERNLIIFLASGTIILTLLLTNFLLPVLAPAEESKDLHADDAESVARILRNVIDRLNSERTQANGQATDSVVLAYSNRLKKHMRKNELEPDSTKQLTIDMLKHMQEFVCELIDNEEVDPLTAYSYLNKLNKRIGYLRHRSESRWWINYARKHMRTLKLSVGHYIRGRKEKITHETGVSDFTLLQIRTVRESIRYLNDFVNDPDSPYPAESVANVKLSQQMILNHLLCGGPSVTAYTKKMDMMEDVQRRAYFIELEEIHNAVEEGTIDRHIGKDMRDNVFLMLVDLGEQYA